MIRILLIVAIACASFASDARAETYVIPLPEVLGTYGFETNVFERVASIQLPGPPTAVNRVSLRVSGTTEVGILLCGVPQQQFPWPTAIEGLMRDDPPNSNFWTVWVFSPDVPGHFEWSQEFTTPSTHPATWGFLADGSAQFFMLGGPAPTLLGGCFSKGPIPNVTVETAELVVEAEIPVPADALTWGRIKSAYR